MKLSSARQALDTQSKQTSVLLFVKVKVQILMISTELLRYAHVSYPLNIINTRLTFQSVKAYMVRNFHTK
jgi:hypothetical protein